MELTRRSASAELLPDTGRSAEGYRAERRPRRGVTIRPMSALELGLVYTWMAADEAQPAESGGEAPTRWWSLGAVGIQQRWEEAAGLVDLELEPGRADKGAGETVGAVVAALESGLGGLGRLLGAASAAASAEQRPLTLTAPEEQRGARVACVVGGFVEGELAPCGFAATKSGAPWDIDALGVRQAARHRGVGRERHGRERTSLARCPPDGAPSTALELAPNGGQLTATRRRFVAGALAEHIIAGARSGGREMLRIDVVPSACCFWAKLGFVRAFVERAVGADDTPAGADVPMELSLLPRTPPRPRS